MAQGPTFVFEVSDAEQSTFSTRINNAKYLQYFADVSAAIR